MNKTHLILDTIISMLCSYLSLFTFILSSKRELDDSLIMMIIIIKKLQKQYLKWLQINNKGVR